MKRFFALVFTAVLSLGALPAEAVQANYGYDISWPQCDAVGTSLPQPGAFNVVGIDGGRVFQANPCLEAELAWAGSTAEVYVNTGNPGPILSSRYAAGSVGGQSCYQSNLNSTGCAFLYGYRAAANSFSRAQIAFSALGFGDARNRTWWLDVERVNSWRGLDNNLPGDSYLTLAAAQKLNVAAIQGAAFYLEAVVKVRRLGIYSVTSHWNEITGTNRSTFSDHESWLAVGTDGEARAVAECLAQDEAFTGAPVTRTQYIDATLNLDVNVPCQFTKASSTSAYLGTKSVYRNRPMTLKIQVKTSLGAPLVSQQVRVVFAGKTYTLVTNSKGEASKSITAPKYRGSYRVSTTYAGNSIFNASKNTSYVKLY